MRSSCWYISLLKYTGIDCYSNKKTNFTEIIFQIFTKVWSYLTYKINTSQTLENSLQLSNHMLYCYRNNIIGSRIYLRVFWYHICRNKLRIIEVMPIWMSTPPDLTVVVKSIDVSVWCSSFLHALLFLFWGIRIRINSFQLSSIKDKSGDKSWPFKNSLCSAKLSPSNQTRFLNFWRSSILVMTCLCVCAHSSLNDHCTKAFTATFNSGRALIQVGITSEILNRFLQMWYQNTRK